MSLGFRLERQYLHEPAESLVEVARRLCGLHAQVLSAADLQLRARVRAHAPGDLGRALWEERSVVKTWLMRGTLHVLPADDLALYVGALDNRGEYAPAWLRAFEVTPAEMEGLIAAIGEALDGTCLTREELVGAVEPRVGRSVMRRLRSGWGEFLKPASRRGVLCFGPSRGQNVTFVRPDEWVGTWCEYTRVEARTELLRRFLRAYAPASRDDFDRWLGSARRVREPWEALADELVEVAPKLFALRADANELARRPRGVRLLGGFDPYVLFPYSGRPVPEAVRDRVYRTAGWISPAVVDRGRVVGVWEQRRRGRRLELTVSAFEPLAARALAAVEREAALVARHLGGDLELRFA